MKITLGPILSTLLVIVIKCLLLVLIFCVLLSLGIPCIIHNTRMIYMERQTQRHVTFGRGLSFLPLYNVISVLFHKYEILFVYYTCPVVELDRGGGAQWHFPVHFISILLIGDCFIDNNTGTGCTSPAGGEVIYQVNYGFI